MMPSRPTNFDGCRRLIAFRNCKSETGAIGRESADGKSVEKSPMLWLLETLLKYAANAAAPSHGWVRLFPTIPSLGLLSLFLKEDIYFQKCTGLVLRLLSTLLAS